LKLISAGISRRVFSNSVSTAFNNVIDSISNKLISIANNLVKDGSSNKKDTSMRTGGLLYFTINVEIFVDVVSLAIFKQLDGIFESKHYDVETRNEYSEIFYDCSFEDRIRFRSVVSLYRDQKQGALRSTPLHAYLTNLTLLNLLPRCNGFKDRVLIDGVSKSFNELGFYQHS